MKPALAVAIAVATGCSSDIRLGGPPDGPADARPDTAQQLLFTPGNYLVSFLDPNEPACTGSLSGKEADFGALTRANLNLVDGSLSLAFDGNHVTLSGTPITSAFAQATISLDPDPSGAPPTLWDTQVLGSFGTGPDGTTSTAVAFALDSATASSPSGIDGAVARRYDDTTAGICSATFGVLLVSN